MIKYFINISTNDIFSKNIIIKYSLRYYYKLLFFFFFEEIKLMLKVVILNYELYYIISKNIF